MNQMGNYGMERKITTISSADLESKFNLNLLGSLEIEDPELVSLLSLEREAGSSLVFG